MTRTIGFEWEVTNSRHTISSLKAVFVQEGLNVDVKYDGTNGVDIEIATSPLVITSDTAKTFVKKVTDVMQREGCKVNRKCGLHVHVSTAHLKDGVCVEEYTKKAIAAYPRIHTDHADPMSFALAKDIGVRYCESRTIINSMFPSSRTDNGFCMANDIRQLQAATTIEQLQDATRYTHTGNQRSHYTRKYSVVNYLPWADKGTIEFRQASATTEYDKSVNWADFLLNLITWSEENRLDNGSTLRETETPVMPFRGGARVGVQYTMMRSENGATVREIMTATGCSEQRVRSAVNEIRNRVGHQAVITHTQQAQGMRNGDGTDHTRYQVPMVTTTGSTEQNLLPENRIGLASIWAGLSDELFEWWQNRIIGLRG